MLHESLWALYPQCLRSALNRIITLCSHDSMHGMYRHEMLASAHRPAELGGYGYTSQHPVPTTHALMPGAEKMQAEMQMHICDRQILAGSRVRAHVALTPPRRCQKMLKRFDPSAKRCQQHESAWQVPHACTHACFGTPPHARRGGQCQARHERRPSRYIACIHQVFPISKTVRRATRARGAYAMPAKCARARHAERQNAGAAPVLCGVQACYPMHCGPFVYAGARKTHGDTVSHVCSGSVVASMNPDPPACSEHV